MPKGRVTAKTASVEAPVGGWNARDPVAAMPEGDAVQMINWWPTTTDIRVRLGYTKACTGFPTPNPVNTVFGYNGVGQALFGAQVPYIYNCTGSTAVSTNFPITSDKLQYVQTSTAGGNFLSLVNGVDDAIIYNGTNFIRSAKFTNGQTITSITVSGTTATLTTNVAHGLFTNNQIILTGATPAALNGAWIVTSVPTATTITFTVPSGTGNATVVGSYSVTGYTGVDSATLINVNLWKNRLWFTPKTGLTAYYSDVNAISGTLSPFPLGSVFRNGGNLVCVADWTIDAGSGLDDYIVFVTSNGEVAVYQGTNPTDATMFALKGVWQLGAPFTPRCFTKYGGDLLLLMHEGLVPLGSALQSSRLDPRVNISDKIYGAIADSTTDYYQNFGWQVLYYALPNMLILNVPNSTGMVQYCMNTITKAWTQFNGLQMYNMCIFKDYLYFGSDGFVAQFWNAPSDAGNNISTQLQQAYSYFGSRAQLKRFNFVRPVFLLDGGIGSQPGQKPGLVIGINYDFAMQNNLAPATFAPALQGLAKWDLATWDGGTVWATGNLEISKEWQSASGLGFAAGLVMNTASQGIDLRLVSVDYVFEPGAIL